MRHSHARTMAQLITDAEKLASSQTIAKPLVSGSLLSQLEEKKKAAFERADAAYYDRNSPHYRDNQRYSWAVKTINSWTVEDCR